MTAPFRPLTAWQARSLGPTCTAAIQNFRRPTLPAGVRYALLLREPRTIGQKPLACASLGELARAIHRRRAEGGLQLVETELTVQGETTPRTGVSVFRLEPSTGDRARLIGWAWLAGAGRLALEHALQAEQPGPVH